MLQTKGIQEVLAWEAEHLIQGLGDELQEAGIRLVTGRHPEIRAGLTGATAGIAETGSILITSGPGRRHATIGGSGYHFFGKHADRMVITQGSPCPQRPERYRRKSFHALLRT